MLTINGKQRDDGPPEDFSADADPITGAPIDPPEQLELKPQPKKPGLFTKRAKQLIKRSGKKLRGGGRC
jgi:hypothetical protein